MQVRLVLLLNLYTHVQSSSTTFPSPSKLNSPQSQIAVPCTCQEPRFPPLISGKQVHFMYWSSEEHKQSNQQFIESYDLAKGHSVQRIQCPIIKSMKYMNSSVFMYCNKITLLRSNAENHSKVILYQLQYNTNFSWSWQKISSKADLTNLDLNNNIASTVQRKLDTSKCSESPIIYKNIFFTYIYKMIMKVAGSHFLYQYHSYKKFQQFLHASFSHV